MSKPKLITKIICLVSAVLSKHRNSDPQHIHTFLGLFPSRFWLSAGRTLYHQRVRGTSFLPYRSLPTGGQIKPKMCFEVLARSENRSDDPGCTQLSDLIVACDYGERQQGFEKNRFNVQ
jgi:hypothetical protein